MWLRRSHLSPERLKQVFAYKKGDVMKSKKIVLLAAIIGAFLISFVSAEKQIVGQIDARQYSVNLGLGGVRKLYVIVALDGRVASKDGIVGEEIEEAIKERLSQVCPEISLEDQKADDEKLQQIIDEKVGAAGNIKARSIDTPEFIVRISTKKFSQQLAAFHVQSSFAKKVYMRASPRSAAKAEVWRLDVPIGSADANSISDAVKAESLRQVDAFVADWKRANGPKVSAEEEPKADVVTSEIRQLPRTVSPDQHSQYPYVASKNSKVFHKAGCRSADRISPDNLVGFSSRDEAINSGRRPCKICKP